jgi:hypothetical protein
MPTEIAEKSPPLNISLAGTGTLLDATIRKQTQGMNKIIMGMGGTVKSVALGMRFQVFLKTEDAEKIDVQPISEAMNYTFEYDNESCISMGTDSDQRIGELAFILATAVLKEIKTAFAQGKLDEHRPED